jgi:hypothetical protein
MVWAFEVRRQGFAPTGTIRPIPKIRQEAPLISANPSEP